MGHYFETKSADGQVKIMLHFDFNEMYIPEPNSGCWLWLGYIDKDGYGRCKRDRAHRVSYRQFIGPLENFSVLHKCDNPSCVNPEHLFLGTQLENIADMVSKKRHAKGIKNRHAKLSLEQVEEIRLDTRPQKIIAANYGISQQQISGIKTKRYWN